MTDARFRVKFERVGREKISWEARLPDLADETLERTARENASLRSRDIGFVVRADGTGFITAGIAHKVGEFSWTRLGDS